MNIGIDLTFFNSKYAGKEINAKNIVELLLKKYGKNNKFYLFVNSNVEIDVKKNEKVNFIYINKISISRLYFRFLGINKYIKKNKIDKLLVLTYNVPFIIKIPVYIYIFDVALFKNSSDHPFGHTFFYKLMLKYFVKRAKHIFTVSETSRVDISDVLGISVNKITNVKSGPNLFNLNIKINSAVENIYNLSNYILTVSTIQPRKNIENLIRSFEIFKSCQPDFDDYKLIIVGKFGWKYETILNYARESQFSKDIIFTGYIDDRKIIEYYKGASLFIYLSKYEGFGLPILEALLFKVPVLCSEIDVFRELFYPYVNFIDISDINLIATKIRDILVHKNRYKISENEVLELNNKFNWNNVVKKVWRVINE